jgi:glutamate formiminotransferase/formiminotetrahydrofolate cyclodeaminase
VPLEALLEAGRYFLRKQQRSAGVSEAELVRIAVKSLGLDDLAPFDPQRRIIEYNLDATDTTAAKRLVKLDLRGFADQTASETPAPGGGSVSAYVGALGAALATMVANLSSHKRGWDDRWQEFSDVAERGQRLKDALLRLVDDDTDAFNAIMTAFALPKGTPEEKAARQAAVQAATRRAIEVPLATMKLALDTFDVVRPMVERGNPNSVTDAGVGALCARTAVYGAFLNVKVNISGLDDKIWAMAVLEEAEHILQQARQFEQEIIDLVKAKIEA